ETEPETIRPERETDRGLYYRHQATEAAARQTRARGCAAADSMASARSVRCGEVSGAAGASICRSRSRHSECAGQKASRTKRNFCGTRGVRLFSNLAIAANG